MDVEIILDFCSYATSTIIPSTESRFAKKLAYITTIIQAYLLKLNSFFMEKSNFYGAKNLAYDIYRKFEIVCLQIGL